VSRAVWIALSAAVVALGVGIAALSAFLGSDASSTATTGASSSDIRGFELPLLNNPSVLTLAGHKRDLLVGIAARRGRPVEVAALRAETPVPLSELRIAVRGREVQAKPCGLGCSRVSAAVLDGRTSSLTVRHGSETVSFDLPRRLPPAGSALFGRALRTMNSLRSYRFTERLSSGHGAVMTRLAVEAPNRLRLRTSSGFASVIIGRARWDLRAGRWERSSFPGLDVRDVLMWHDAKNPRIIGRRANGNSELAAFGLKPVAAWFRLEVAPTGRVVQAEMTAASHFMLHRYSDFNAGVTIKAPR
jgi:hypothetical protein